MSSISCLLTNLDCCSSQIGFTYKGKRRYKSLIGGCLTIMCFIVIMAIIIAYMVKYFTRAEKTIFYQEKKDLLNLFKKIKEIEIMQRLYLQNQQVLSESILQKLKEEEIFVNENCTLVSSSSVGQSESKNKTALLSGLALSPIKKKKISKFITNTLKEVNNKLLDIKGKS